MIDLEQIRFEWPQIVVKATFPVMFRSSVHREHDLNLSIDDQDGHFTIFLNTVEQKLTNLEMVPNPHCFILLSRQKVLLKYLLGHGVSHPH